MHTILKSGEKIKAVREARGLTQADFGRIIGIAGNYVGMIERGEKKASEKVIRQVKTLFGVSSTWWETGEGDIFANKFRQFADRLNEKPPAYPDLTPSTPGDLYKQVLKRAVDNMLDGIDVDKQEEFVAKALLFFQEQKQKQKKDRD